jgi:predicted dehydrogenase
VVLIAGFHHTHAGLAVEALRRGGFAVVEKPLITRRDQLDPLLAEVERSPRLFACFHKRYSAFNAQAALDLAVRPGDPIHYHCVVFEEPLPDLHWYRWPNSGSRLVSNGCHWIDHFLFLNGYAKPIRSTVLRALGDIAIVTVELENGAVFSMTLGDQGSPRLGVREYIELRAGQRTSTIMDATRYRSEDRSRVLRRLRVGRQESYTRMYRSIGKTILAGGEGDSLASIEVCNRLLIDLEDQLQQQPVGPGSGLSSPGR